MHRGLFFTTMKTHRPVYIPPPTDTPRETTTATETATATATATATVTPPTTTNRQAPRLRDNLVRSTQPAFSVSAIFAVRSGGGCSTCGH